MEDLKKKIDEIEDLKSKLKDELRRKKDLNEKVKSLRELNDEKVVKLVEVGEKLKTTEINLKEVSEEVENLKTLMKQKDQQIEELKVTIKKIEEDYEKSKMETTKGLEEELKLFKEKEYKRFETEKSDLKTQVKDLTDKLEKTQSSEKKFKDELTKSQVSVDSLNIVSKNQSGELLQLRKQVDIVTKERDDSENQVKVHLNEIKKLNEEITKLKASLPKKDIPKWKETLDKIKNNDKDTTDISFVNVGISDQYVIELCQAMAKNTSVSKIDFSDNILINGECAKNIAELLMNSHTILELMFNGCPIRPENIKTFKDGIKKNQSLVQCALGTNETEDDVQEIEMIMERNFQILSQ